MVRRRSIGGPEVSLRYPCTLLLSVVIEHPNRQLQSALLSHDHQLLTNSLQSHNYLHASIEVLILGIQVI